MKTKRITLVYLSLIFVLAGCGNSSDSTTKTYTNIPIELSIEDTELSAGVPKTFTYTLPAPSTPYTDISIDLVKTLESANITVTAAP